MGHVRKVPSKRQAVVDDDTKLNLLLALEENPIIPARQLARDSNLNHKTVLKILKCEKKRPYKMKAVQELLEDDPDRRYSSLLIPTLTKVDEGYGGMQRSQDQVCVLFNEFYPNRSPINQSIIKLNKDNFNRRALSQLEPEGYNTLPGEAYFTRAAPGFHYQ
ncbi:hypothetical protein NQ318_001479 [Aromia moschata]|uniref:Uncharacterized protein n=1 Tax=Aromia moschata TaxID=1265417 RepID=A0AAV8X9T4_9CUCU|nr:hypothetical protein NQ318_001479 [Aromia moschata]